MEVETNIAKSGKEIQNIILNSNIFFYWQECKV